MVVFKRDVVKLFFQKAKKFTKSVENTKEYVLLWDLLYTFWDTIKMVVQEEENVLQKELLENYYQENVNGLQLLNVQHALLKNVLVEEIKEDPNVVSLHGEMEKDLNLDALILIDI